MRWINWTGILILPGILVLHELGHYLAARRAGIPAVEFAIGFGPRLAGWHAFGTLWTLRAIPFGGYVRFAEEGPGAVADAPLSTRLRVWAAGPVANFATALLLLWLLATARGASWWQFPWVAAQWFGYLVGAWGRALGALLAGAGAAALAGPVAIAGQAVQATAGGRLDLLDYAAKLSLNLGLVNLLPIPVLDGGRLLLLALERLRGRRLQPEAEGCILTGSALGMLILAVLLVVKDVWTLTGSGLA